MSSTNQSKESIEYGRKQAQAMSALAAAVGAKITYRGGTWWHVEWNDKSWLIRGASNVIQRLKRIEQPQISAH